MLFDGVGFNSTPLLQASINHRHSTCCGYYFFESTITHHLSFLFLSLSVNICEYHDHCTFLSSPFKLRNRNQVPPTKAKTIFLTAIGLGRGYFVAGMHSGHIYLFEGNKLKAFADAHKSGTGGKTGCQTLHLKTDPTRKQDAESVQFVSGGSDGQIILWDFKFPKKGSEPRLEEIRNSRFNISSITPRPKNHCIKSVCWDGSLKNILIGTQGSEAYSIGTVTVVLWCGGDFSCCCCWWWFYVLYILLQCIMVLFSPCSYAALL